MIQVVESAVILTPSHRVHSSSHFDLEFDIKDRKQRVKLVLEPNHDIIPHGAGISYLDANGEVESWEPLDRTQHRIFKGAAWLRQRENVWDQLGWSRITVLQDGPEPVFEGSFSIMHDSHHIQLRHKFEQTRHSNDPIMESAGEGDMILFRDSDTFGHPWHGDLRKRDQSVLACSADKLNFNADPFHPIHRPFGYDFGLDLANVSLARRQIDGSTQPSGNAGSVNYRNTIGQIQGCPNTRKVALVGVAVDCTYRSGFNTRNDTASHVVSVMNMASQVYEATFNITLGLKNLTIQEPDCPATAQTATPWNLGCESSLNISSRLNSFSAWRGQFQDNNAYWMMLTNCTTGPEVGLSWLGQLCVSAVSTLGDESTSGANVVARTSTEWQVIAHETGHMFGAVHDCDGQTCASSTAVTAQQCCPLSASTCDANSQFIMNPSTGNNIQAFSACTIGNICGAMYRKSVNNNCLVDNRGVAELITAQQCGNGIVEGDEECDCGGQSGCQGNNCCDPTTCKFINNAVCDQSNEQCCSECQFATNGTVCRATTGVCDPQEVCSGTSATCPSDIVAPNGQDCGNGLQCASGQCTSRDQQCKTLMGSITTNNSTYACPSSDCTLSCASPNGVCYSMQQYFVDGTPCGSGTCSNVSCLFMFETISNILRVFARVTRLVETLKTGLNITSRWLLDSPLVLVDYL